MQFFPLDASTVHHDDLRFTVFCRGNNTIFWKTAEVPTAQLKTSLSVHGTEMAVLDAADYEFMHSSLIKVNYLYIFLSPYGFTM